MSQIHSKCIITREWLVGHWRDAVHAYVAPAEAVPKLQETRLLYGTSVDRRKFRLQSVAGANARPIRRTGLPH